MRDFLRQIYHSQLSDEARQRIYKLRHPAHYKTLRQAIHHSKKGSFSIKPFDQHHCIFIHVTKTAGTSVAMSLFDYLPYHYTAIDYRVIYGKKTFEKYFKFAFVRNPWGRLYSAYRYLKAGGWNDEDKQWYADNLSEFTDFNQFILTWVNKENIEKHLHFKPQCQFLCDKKNTLLVDYLAYFETINDDFNKIAKYLNIPARIGHHNANTSDSYLNAYNEATIQIVADVYAEDIALFGYQFDGISERKTITQLPL